MLVSHHSDPDSSRYLPQPQEACASANSSVSIKDPTAEQFCSQNHILLYFIWDENWHVLRESDIHKFMPRTGSGLSDFYWFPLMIFCDISLTGSKRLVQNVPAECDWHAPQQVMEAEMSLLQLAANWNKWQEQAWNISPKWIYNTSSQAVDRSQATVHKSQDKMTQNGYARTDAIEENYKCKKNVCSNSYSFAISMTKFMAYLNMITFI